QRIGTPEPCAEGAGAGLSSVALVDTARFRPLHRARRSARRVRADRPRGGRAGAARRVTLVRFFRADGSLDKEVDGRPGERLLDVAWRSGQPLEGACEGVMACSTCHVLVDPEDFPKLPPASEEEED